MLALQHSHALLVRQLQVIAPLSTADQLALASLPMHSAGVRSGDAFMKDATRTTSCCFVLSGLICRHKMIDGGRRQILSFNFAGDLPDLQGLHTETMDHGLLALSDAVVAFIPHQAMDRVMDQNRGVRHALLKHLVVDAAISRQWLVNVGRRSALERIAHLLCESYVRLKARGLIAADRFRWLPTQEEVGDASGLSTVHVNRTLKELRSRNLLKGSGRMFEIDFNGMKDVAGFDPAYLHMM